MLAFYLALIDEEEDKQKFEKIYNKYRILMFSTAKTIFTDDRIAEEAVQEAFIKIAKNINQIEEIEGHKTRNFTVIITKNTCLDMLEKEKRHSGIASFEDVRELDASEDFDFNNIDKREFLNIIKGLSEDDRNIILLKFYHSYKEKEIAELLGISYSAMRKRMQRAKAHLGLLLEDWR